MNDLYNYLLYQTITSKLPERIILKENIKELIDLRLLNILFWFKIILIV